MNAMIVIEMGNLNVRSRRAEEGGGGHRDDFDIDEYFGERRRCGSESKEDWITQKYINYKDNCLSEII